MFGRHDDVAQVQAAMDDAGRRGAVERVGKQPQPRQRVGDVGGTEFPECHVERVAVDEGEDHERLRLLDTGLEDRAERRMRGQPLPHRGEGRADDRRALGCEPDPQHLDHDRSTRLRVLSTKHRADAAGTDLVQDAHAPVRSTRPVEQEAVLGQWMNSSTRTVDGVAHILARGGTAADRVFGLVDTPQGLCKSSRSVSSPSAPASAAGGLAIDIRQLPWISRLAADYAFAFENLAPFYAGDPRRPDAWAEVIARVQATPRAVPALSSMLLAQLAAREAPPAAREAAAAFEHPGTVAVLTGQQAGLFGGPLYTLHKALTAIKLARQISAAHGVTAVPVFWIDSEDHDWEEVRRCTVLDDTQAPRTVTAADVEGAGRPADCPADARRPGRPGDRGFERRAASHRLHG